MGGQQLYSANPPPDPSQLPDDILTWRKDLKLDVLSPEELHNIQEFRKAADYIAAGTLTRFRVLCASCSRFNSDDFPQGQHYRRA